MFTLERARAARMLVNGAQEVEVNASFALILFDFC